MDVERQIALMNDMLDYLRRKTYKVFYNKDYEKITLTWDREKSLLFKRVRSWDYNKKKHKDEEKEKALGGHNGDLIFEEIKKETIKVAKSRIMKDAVRQELLNIGIDWEELVV
jgi:hypothetical protein